MESPYPALHENELRRWSVICLIIIVLAPFVIFWPVTIGSQIWAVGDFASYQVPMNTVAMEQWRQGKAPLWNSYLNAGTPLAAVQNPGIFYPINIVLWLTLPAWLMLGYAILIHLALAGLATYLFLRSLRLHPVAALLGGIVFQLSGFAMSHLGHVMILRALPWIGFTLYAFNGWIETRKSRYLGAIALSVLCLYLSGYPQVIVYASLLIGTYFIFARRINLHNFVCATLAALLGVCMSALQLFPGITLWLSKEFIRPGEGLFSSFASFSFHPLYVLTLFFPRVRQGLAVMVGYIGVVPLFLAVLGFLHGRAEAEEDGPRIRNFFGLWAGLSLFLSFGRYVNPITQWTFHIPLYGDFDGISKHLMEFDFSLAVLAACGLHGLMCPAPSYPRQKFRIILLSIIAGTIAVMAVLIPFGADASPLIWFPFFKNVGKPLLFMASGGILIWFISKRKTKWTLVLSFVLISTVLFDLADFGTSIYSTGLTSPDFYRTSPASARKMMEQSKKGDPFRILPFEATGAEMECNLAKDVLAANLNATYQIESLIGHEGLELKRFFSAFGERIPPWGNVPVETIEDPQFRHLVDLYGVRYLLSRKEDANHLVPFYPQILSTERISLFENPHARSRLSLLATPPSKDRSRQQFGGQLTLLNYQVKKIAPSDKKLSPYVISMWWSCQAPISEDYTLYVHYLDNNGRIRAQWDHRLGPSVNGSLFPTSRWNCPGNYRDEFFVPTAAVVDGKLHVALGLWIPETNARLAASGDLPVDIDGGTRFDIQTLEKATVDDEKILWDDHRRMWVDQEENAAVSNSIKITSYSGDHIAADVAIDVHGLLVHNTNFVRGWKARLDGQEQALIRVFDALQAVYVPPGKHKIEFWYEPREFKTGLRLSAVSLGMTVLLCLIARRKKCKDGVRG
jgi:hypothetical protein